MKSQKNSTNTAIIGMFVLHAFYDTNYLSSLTLLFSVSVFFHRSHPHLGLLEQATLKQCVVGPNHAGFLLEVILFYIAIIITPVKVASLKL